MNQVLIGRQLTYEYSQIGERRIGVFDIDISLEKGQALGLVGESGSGNGQVRVWFGIPSNRLLSRQQQTIKGIKHAGNERSAGAVSR